MWERKNHKLHHAKLVVCKYLHDKSTPCMDITHYIEIDAEEKKCDETSDYQNIREIG